MANKNKKNFNHAGFSLIEMLVATAVFLIVVTASVASFVSVIKTQRTTREIQKKIEGAGTAVEIMSKIIRMGSSVKSYNSGKEIRLYNDSQDKCVSYKFQNNNLEVSELSGSGDPSSCATSTYSSYLVMVSGVHGLFKVVETSSTPHHKKMGKATVLIEIVQEHLQTSVSCMNYASII
ncbi:MAG TPA: prepilin-type N-terminal cleavage/methylation domain-containing protein [Candidatus Moranbacteria bacterium]|nr:prepilin-type N-terminal cleavage/methylation domain-containing protein [Candidatus Moranbacteria bacterium]